MGSSFLAPYTELLYSRECLGIRHFLDDKEVERTFCLSRPDGWVINRKMERIILLEFKRTSEASETYYTDMKKTADTQDTPILTGLNTLARERG